MRQENLLRLSSLEINRNARDFLVMHYLINDLRFAIDTYGKGDVLDVGCGNKPYEPLFREIKSYMGCDVVQSDKQKVDVICPATDLQFSKERFDTVFTTQVIEHVDDPFKMLSECNRVLKRNGCIILSAPFAWELHEQPFDFYRYTKYGLKAMLEKNEFELLLIKANGGKWAAISQLQLNIIYSTFKGKGLFRKFLKILFVNFRLTAIINSFALWLDKKFYDDLLTLNYIVVAKKM